MAVIISKDGGGSSGGGYTFLGLILGVVLVIALRGRILYVGQLQERRRPKKPSSLPGKTTSAE